MLLAQDRILVGLALLVVFSGCKAEGERAPVDVAAAFASVMPGMTDGDVIEHLGAPTESNASRSFVKDSVLWAIRESSPIPVRIWSYNMTDEELAQTMAPGDTTYSRTDTWERWDDGPPDPHTSTWLVFYMKEEGVWRVVSTEDRSSGIVF